MDGRDVVTRWGFGVLWGWGVGMLGMCWTGLCLVGLRQQQCLVIVNNNTYNNNNYYYPSTGVWSLLRKQLCGST